MGFDSMECGRNPPCLLALSAGGTPICSTGARVVLLATRHQALAKLSHYQRRVGRDPTRSVEGKDMPGSCACPSDLTHAAWMQSEPLIPEAKPGGRPYAHSRRTLVNAYYYLVRTGCTWRMLPSDFPPWQTVHWHITQWRRAGILSQIWAILEKERRDQARHSLDAEEHEDCIAL